MRNEYFHRIQERALFSTDVSMTHTNSFQSKQVHAVHRTGVRFYSVNIYQARFIFKSISIPWSQGYKKYKKYPLLFPKKIYWVYLEHADLLKQHAVALYGVSYNRKLGFSKKLNTKIINVQNQIIVLANKSSN